MPSSRRIRLLFITVVAIVVSILYLTNSARRSNTQFYDRTVAAIERKAAAKAASESRSQPKADTGPAQAVIQPQPQSHEGSSSDSGVSSDGPLGGVEKEADSGGEKGEVPVDASQREPVGSVKAEVEEDGKEKGKEGKKEKEKEGMSDEEKKVEGELNAILKRSPIIIFSKSYCPYSKKAKAVFGKYALTPAPYIVELDKHEMGAKLQEALGKATQRRTVPNILIGGVSIGGGDEVVAMDAEDKLLGKIKELGGKRMVEVKKKG